MAKAKAAPTFLEKLSEKASHVKEDLLAGKDHLVEVAGDAIASVKHSIEEYKAKKASAAGVEGVSPVAGKKLPNKKSPKSGTKRSKQLTKSPAKSAAKKVAAKKQPVKKKAAAKK